MNYEQNAQWLCSDGHGLVRPSNLNRFIINHHCCRLVHLYELLNSRTVCVAAEFWSGNFVLLTNIRWAMLPMLSLSIPPISDVQSSPRMRKRIDEGCLSVCLSVCWMLGYMELQIASFSSFHCLSRRNNELS